jgi:hypothetical protein
MQFEAKIETASDEFVVLKGVVEFLDYHISLFFTCSRSISFFSHRQT